ncbi:prepilin peptidase [Coprococcus sp. AF21-14LB]|uniref:prepilin peptidase n=1 Tax=Coprococcus sp. AF21-14LB TaxID=2292231 RepID=UPI000E4D9E20|nr:prepilin peptidase [Coprococcus sp. AF21-14LB]RGS77931.1 hypothetical protein DWX73_09660 [Coprococcus sp. AF21-14LB]
MFTIGVRSVETIAVILMIGLGMLDWKQHRLPKLLLGALTVLAVIARVGGNISFPVFISGMIPGVLFLILSCMTREGVGYGDGWIVLILGVVFGLWKTVYICMIALFGMACAAIFGMSFLHWDKKKRLAFVPFLAVGCLGVILI